MMTCTRGDLRGMLNIAFFFCLGRWWIPSAGLRVLLAGRARPNWQSPIVFGH